MNKEEIKSFMKDINDYEYLLNYLIEKDGTIKRKYVNGKTKILKPQLVNGYHCVRLSKNGKPKNFKVHQLVAKMYIPNPNNFIEINHINGIKTDNRVENLEWCSRKHNQKEMYRLGLHKPINNSKPFYQLDINGNVINEFRTLREAQKITGINNSYICQRLKDGKIVKNYCYFRYSK